MRQVRRVAVVLAVLCAGCRPQKYASFGSPWGDYRCDAPRGWRVVEESQGEDYAAVTLAGDLDPDFYLGTPSFSIRWHAHGRPRRLPGGGVEVYASAEDYLERMPREVYGPGVVELERERISVSGRDCVHLRLFSPAPAPSWRRYGIAEEEGTGRAVNLRDHSYVVVPGRAGFHVIIYPATRQGYPKLRDRFFRLVNTFHAVKDGPGGSLVGALTR